MQNERVAHRRIIPYFTVCAFIEFIIYYVFSLLAKDFDAVYYYVYFVERFILIAVPVTAAAVMIRRSEGWADAAKMAAFIALTRLIVFIPFFYIEYVYGIYDSLEAILLSLLSSVGGVVIYFLLILGIYALMHFIIERRGGAEYPIRMLDLSSPATFSMLVISLMIFVINLGFEIYSTVLFFIENGTIYYIDEIVLMLLSYVFLAVLLIGIHALGCLALNRSGYKDE